MQSSKKTINTGLKSPIEKDLDVFFFTESIQCHLKRHSKSKENSQNKDKKNFTCIFSYQ